MVVVAPDDNLVAVWQPLEKIIESRYILDCPAHRHVSGKNKEVAIRDFHPLVEHVGIAEGSDSHVSFRWCNILNPKYIE